jgi:membrane protein DedA with SNARE-associated domain
VLDRFLDWLAHLPTAPTYLVLMGLSAVENVFPPVPADVAVALGAFLARRGELSATWLGVLCWLANQASSTVVYFVARAHGPHYFRHGWGRRLVPPGAFTAIRDAYVRYGALGIFLSRFLPGIRAAVMPFAGVAGLSPARALLPAAAASAIWYTFLVVAGLAVGESLESVRRFIDDANRVLGLLALAASAAFAFWLWRRMRSRAGSDERPPD